MARERPGLPPGPRRTTSGVFQLLVGVVVGMLLAGLLVPLVVGESRTTSVATADLVTGQPDQRTSDTDAGASSEPAGPSMSSAPVGPVPADRPVTASASDRRDGDALNQATTATTVVSRLRGAASREQGVTATSVRVGFLLYDLGGTASRIGFTGSATGLDPQQQRAAFEAYVGDLNRRGGVAGRRWSRSSPRSTF